MIYLEGVSYEMVGEWGVGYVISESDAFNESDVDDAVTSELIASMFQPGKGK